MTISKFLSDIFGEKGHGGLVSLSSLLTLKNGTRTSYFQSNEPPPKFMRPPFPYECFWEKINNNNKTSEPYILYYRQRYSVASDGKKWLEVPNIELVMSKIWLIFGKRGQIFVNLFWWLTSSFVRFAHLDLTLRLVYFILTLL
jgi:hypothetical protein